MDYNLALMAGIDIPIPECQITLHQPTLKEIAYIGEEDFFIGVQCLCIDANSIIQQDDIIENISNFEIFLTIMLQQDTRDKKNITIQVLSLLLPDYTFLFTPRSILLKKNDKTFIIDDKNFDTFQKVLKMIFCFSSSSGKDGEMKPANAKAQEIAKKLLKGRQRVAAQKKGENKNILSQYVSVVTVAVQSMSLQDSLNLTIYQLYDLIERYGLYTNWDIDIRSRLAGAKIDTPPDNWMKNIH